MNKYFLYYELVYRSNEVIGKDCTIIEAENLNDELLHKKKLEIESKENEYTKVTLSFIQKIVEDNKLITKNNFVAACDMGDGLVYIIECGSDKKEVTIPWEEFTFVK